MSETGIPLSDIDVEEQKALRQMLGAKASLERIDAYSKWIFTLTTIVATVGVGLGAISLPEDGNARLLYAGSIVFFALALGFAAWALKPQWLYYHPHSLEDMRESAGQQIKDRRSMIGGAAVCLVIALMAAGFTPFASTLQSRGTAGRSFTVVYEIVRRDTIAIGIRGSRFGAHGGLTVEMRAGNARFGVTRMAADTLGNLSATVTTPTRFTSDTIEIVAYPDHAAPADTQRITVQLPPAN